MIFAFAIAIAILYFTTTRRPESKFKVGDVLEYSRGWKGAKFRVESIEGSGEHKLFRVVQFEGLTLDGKPANYDSWLKEFVIDDLFIHAKV